MNAPNLAATNQALIYAQDLAKLYKRAREADGRADRVEGRLDTLGRVFLDLIRSPSTELAGDRIATAVQNLEGATTVGVFVLRGERCQLLAARGDDAAKLPARPAIGREDLVSPGPAGDKLRGAPWDSLGMGEPLVLPLPGKLGRPVGFAVAVPAVSGDAASHDLAAARSLLASYAGVLIETLLAEEARSELRHVTERRERETDSKGEARDPFADIRGESPAVKSIVRLISRIAPVDSPVLIVGDTGTGKELAAHAIHRASKRRKGPFVALNCGAVPDSLIESELFGHEQGAFTGAQRRHRGKIEMAQGGTLFLDEVGEMPLALQVKLLRFLEDRKFSRLGSETEQRADVRIVAATNRDLRDAVAQGRLREDLLFRLSVFTLEMPPLRSRGADVLVIARAVAAEIAQRYGLPEARFTPEAERAMLDYAWPGNVRELRNVVEKAVVLANGESIGPALLPTAGEPSPAAAPRSATTAISVPTATASPVAPDGSVTPFADAKKTIMEKFEIAYVESVLAASGGNIAKAARMAKIDKKNLHRKVRAYGLDPRAHKR